jgi:hypothetical protein
VTSRSLVQRSPAECRNGLRNLRYEAAKRPYKDRKKAKKKEMLTTKRNLDVILTWTNTEVGMP